MAAFSRRKKISALGWYLVFWHPLKGPCQQKILHHHKKMLFFCRDIIQQRDQPLFFACARDFKSYRCGSLTDLLPGTHQVQGQWKKKVNRRLPSNHPFFFMTPGPRIGPQKNIGTLLCPMGCYKKQGLKNASHRGLTTRADREKRHPPGFLLRECNGVPTKLWGFQPPEHTGSPFQSQLLKQQALSKRNLISHDVIANPSQLIAQRFGCKARICLG